MTKKITRLDITSIEQLQAAILQVCKENPNKIVTSYTAFQVTRIYIYNRQPTTDSPDTIETFQEDGGFWKNGKIIQPSKTWFRKHNFCPVSR